MEEKIKFGTEIIDGRIYNLDTMPIDELQNLENKLQNEIETLEKEILADTFSIGE